MLRKAIAACGLATAAIAAPLLATSPAFAQGNVMATQSHVAYIGTFVPQDDDDSYTSVSDQPLTVNPEAPPPQGGVDITETGQSVVSSELPESTTGSGYQEDSGGSYFLY
ncbi:hypothetical protein GCM10009530_20480 [Microbispora corallina]|uniref:Secreted protein n=1 Tax=Microbispora corallina TaxID=83302 RepID=A0ABQ4FTY8_9ACTN|nr:hypothetical protein Mco01_12920 [Microbispora corallina]